MRPTAAVRKILHHPRPGRFLLSRGLWATGLCRRFFVQLPDGPRLRFYPSAISASLWVDAGARAEDADFLRAALGPGETLVDCGANVGHLTLVGWARVGRGGEVFAIEASPRIHRYLQSNVELNRATNIRTFNVALGEAAGSVTIADRRDDDQAHVDLAAGHGVNVPMVRLDDLLPDTHVTVLKVDVEGAELQVLKGAARVLSRTSVVYCELSRSNCARFDSTPTEVEALLVRAGFRLLRSTPDGFRFTDVGVFDSLQDHERRATGYNLVALRDSFLPRFVDRFGAPELLRP